ncbi:hypothetical protein ABIB50_001992 [Mucilaginibacter sp. UYCu711]
MLLLSKMLSKKHFYRGHFIYLFKEVIVIFFTAIRHIVFPLLQFITTTSKQIILKSAAHSALYAGMISI